MADLLAVSRVPGSPSARRWTSPRHQGVAPLTHGGTRNRWRSRSPPSRSAQHPDERLRILSTTRTSSHVRLSNVPASSDRLDATDARLLLALSEDPRATVLSLAQTLGLARNTVQARLGRLESGGVLDPFERRVRPEALGYRLGAY